MGAWLSGIHQARATESAANTAADAQRDGMTSQERIAREGMAAQKEQAATAQAFLEKQSAQARADLEPFRQSQVSALGKLQGLSEAGNPFEGQQRQVATQQIQQQLAAQGLLRSKNQTDLLSNLEMGLAQQNYQNRVGLLGSLSGTGAAQSMAGIATGLGQGVAGLQGNLGAQLGSSFGQLGGAVGAGMANIGQIYGNAGIASAGYLASGATQTANNLSGLYQSFQQNKANQNNMAYQQNLLNRMYPAQTSAGGSSGSSGGGGGYSGASLGVDTNLR